MNPFQKQVKIIVVVAALLMIAFVYSGHFHNGFFYDDIYCIQQNLAIHSLKNIPSFFVDSRQFSAIEAYRAYRPFFVVSFAIDYYLGNGLNPVLVHIHSFLGFLALCFLLFLFAKKIFSTVVPDPFYPSLLTACIFALHPATADVVNYIYGRGDMFAALYGMLSVVLYLYSPFCKKYYLYLIPLLVGCLFKINASMYVPMLWAYILFFEEDKGVNGFLPKFKSVALKILPGFITIMAALYLTTAGGTSQTYGVTRYTSLLTQVHVLFNYFMLFFIPENINPNGWRNFITSPFDIQFISGLTFLIISGVAIYITSLYKSLRPLAFGLLWFFVFLIPISVLIIVAVPQVDYYVFNSMPGMAIAAAGVLTFIYTRLKQFGRAPKMLLITMSLVIVCFFSYGSRKRVKVWSSDVAMYEDVLKKDPTNGRVLMNYGTVLMGQGNTQGAEQYFEEAKQFAPSYDLIYVNLGIIRTIYNDTIVAEADFKQAVDLNGWDHYMACFFYGRYLAQHHKIDEAIVQLNEAVKEYPSYPDAWHVLMDIYYARHDKELVNICRQTLKLMPDDAFAASYLQKYASDSLHYNNGSIANDSKLEKQYAVHPTADGYISLSLTYFGKGEYKKVVEACKKAIELNPKLAVAYNNMCAAYNNMQMWDDAIIAGQKALKIQPDFALAQNNLNFALQQKQKAGK